MSLVSKPTQVSTGTSTASPALRANLKVRCRKSFGHDRQVELGPRFHFRLNNQSPSQSNAKGLLFVMPSAAPLQMGHIRIILWLCLRQPHYEWDTSECAGRACLPAAGSDNHKIIRMSRFRSAGPPLADNKIKAASLEAAYLFK